MKNWSTDEEKLKKTPLEYTRWRLESLINFGLDGSKINEIDLRQEWGVLRIDPAKRKFLDLLIHGN
ncbi:MAG: hypothetical protein AAB965_00960 [Patescibacteria group bacterium]